jgi:hypothetical protein
MSWDGDFPGNPAGYPAEQSPYDGQTEIIERPELPADRGLRIWSWIFAFVLMAALGTIAGALAAGYH